MRTSHFNFKAVLKATGRGCAALVFAVAAGFGQQQVNLTAGPTTTTLPDGSTVPMWGYSCSAVNGSAATCAPLNPNAAGAWSPVVITVPTGQALTINLTNALSFTPTGSSNPNTIPTSIVIVGQVGGGLGMGGHYVPSPDHSEAQANVTWPIANTGAQGTPPVQGQRVQSFGTEVAVGTPVALTWSSLRPGTYLLESGTHPSIQVPMGLIGMLVVTCAPGSSTATCANPGQAYPAITNPNPVTYSAEVPLEFSEIDPVQNSAVNAAVNTAGFSETATFGPFGAGPITHINVTAGGAGYTSATTVSITGGGGSGATAVPVITGGAITAINITNGGAGYTSAPTITITDVPAGGTAASASALLAAGANSQGHCAEGLSAAAAACYPSAVNYTPLYYLINGVAFSRASAASSMFPVSPASGVSATGTVLVRMVNAGLRMHIPAIVGSQTTGFGGSGNDAGAPGGSLFAPANTTVTGLSLIAEDGNPIPGVPKVQSDVFMAAGKTFDVMINVPPSNTSAIPVFDRELSLSGNSTERDAGMLAYISVNGAGLPPSPEIAAAVANPDYYNAVIPGQTLNVSDASKGVIANDVNVYGAKVSAAPAAGTLVLNANGTFTYTPDATWSATSNPTTTDSFVYQANGNGPTATVTLNLGTVEQSGGIVVNPVTYNSKMATSISVPAPGVLSVDKDNAGYPLTVAVSTVSALMGSGSGATLTIEPNGGFVASVPASSTATSYTFTYEAQNSQGTLSTPATVTLNFPAPSNLAVTVKDPQSGATLSDYRWIIEEDKTFYINPACTTNANPQPPGCPQLGGVTVPPTFGVNFHTSHMEFVAQGCTGPLSCESGQTVLGVPMACDVGNGACVPPDPTTGGVTAVLPSQVSLDPGCGFNGEPTCGGAAVPYPRRYYISVLPGDAANPFNTGNVTGSCSSDGSNCGHTMGGAPISWNTTSNAWNAVTALVEPTPLPPGKLSVIVFEDDFPLNGEQDSGGGIDVIATNEPGLGGFNIVLWDDMGGSGDVTGQMTYDMFNQPLSNALAGQIDPATGLDACPISPQITANTLANGNGPTTQTGITGMIVTCPKYESDGKTQSPLAGQAVVANLMPGRFSVQAIPGADRIARGEEWLQTNTLDGQHPHDSFIRIGEPAYFQEYGPAGYHVAIGFANPKIINARATGVCNGTDLNLNASNCTNTVTGRVTTERMSRTPDERLYSSGSRDSFYWTQCFVSLGDPDGEDFLFTKCDAKGNFTLTGVPTGSWRLSIFDQWNDQLMDGLSTPVVVGNANNQTVAMGDVPVQQWQSNVYTRTFIDDNKDGVYQSSELGIPFLNTTVRYRDGSLANNLLTDFTGTANFNETFPLFNWYVVETDTTRYKTTGIHTVYDAGGPADGTTCAPNYPACGAAGTPYAFLANTIDANPLPADLSVPGAVYCGKADCSDQPSGIAGGPVPSSATASTGRIDPPWVVAEGWQGYSGQNNFIEFGKTPYAPNENGGIRGHVIYASTRPFDDPTMLVQTQWEPLVPHVTMNLYQEGFAADGVTPTLNLIDTTQTSSWDDWAQGFRSSTTGTLASIAVTNGGSGYAAAPTVTLSGNGTATAVVDLSNKSSPTFGQVIEIIVTNAGSGYTAAPAVTFTGGGGTGAAATAYLGSVPNMNCPGQSTSDLFYFTLQNQPNYLDVYNSYYNSGTLHALPYNSQYKCYDGMHNWNQLQPAPYDGMYAFPSVTSLDPSTGKPIGPAASIASVSETGSTVTVTTSAAHGFSSGNFVFIAGVTPAGYDGAFNVTVTNSTSFTYTAPSMNLGTATLTNATATAAATNCTACIPNPDASDPYRYGMPMLPPGKYVVEVVMPPGYELVKEEDKNILIGDNFIAPVTQEFGGLGDIFIMPDQASVASTYDESGAGYNPNNAQNATENLGASPNNQIVPGFVEPVWPCVGQLRTVPDYISLFPQSHEVSPFAGASRHLCDRKEVTLGSQMGATAKFYIYTSTHIASKYTGVITDDFTSEFDPFAPVFGEKFSPPNMPVSVKDWAGNETSRVYSDQWGDFNGLTYSTWEVNPPNPTGYSPTMMVQCMNDPGPIPGPNGGSITDPLFNPLYSQFCYELPYMPGQTDYLDTPVVPTGGFVGAGYNNPDCNYPDATPAIASVTSQDIAGPWVSAAGHSLTINALGDRQVINYGYSGPSATAAPFNAKTVNRHYGFGSTQGTVTIGGIAATISAWSDTSITITVPSGVPNCAIQQQALFGGSTAQCGQLLITAANGKQSVDTVTVTIGGKMPTVLAAGKTIQSAIDAAMPGDMIIVPPGTYNELLLMWKPVRVQGVGAVSSIINANTQPAGKLNPWRASVNCLFGLALNGQPDTSGNPFDPTGTYSCPAGNAISGTGPDGNTWNYVSGGVNYPSMVVDRVPLEGILGWDATVNGNLAEQLQEPSIMGAYEGAGITVLAKGVNIPAGSSDVFGSGAEAAFPTGTVLLTASDCPSSTSTNQYFSNFLCNPSGIDALSITDSSQGGGGIFLHAWTHDLQVANNRVYNNAGTLSGGMTIGQGEFPEAYLAPNSSVTTPPGSCQDSSITNTQLPYCLQLNVSIHNNSITQNSSTGDELFSGTPAGAGGISICTGSDYYRFNYNWVCGNLSTGDGGGLGHLGFSYNGDIEHNSFLFNQSTNPSIQTSGGGAIIMGAAPDGNVNGVECGTVTDTDCVPGLSDGTGPGLVINANLFMGNGAEAGSGGGLRLQSVNGTDVSRFPSTPSSWYSVQITNNIISNNVAGWDGAGISLEDSLAVNITNNTVSSNDSTASSGVLFNTLGAPLSSSQSPTPTCVTQAGGTISCPQPAGIVTMQNSPQLTSSFTTGPITCPPGNYSTANGGTASNGTCISISYPILYNNIVWQNRSFDISVGALGTSTTNQQNVVSLYNANFSGTAGPSNAAVSQSFTGACPSNSSYWDIGVRGDTGPENHGSGFTLSPLYSVLTDTTGYDSSNMNSNPAVVSQYCNGSRVPPENGGLGYNVPPGIADAVVPNPVFSLTPTATVDEGNNWVNISWGPLSLTNPSGMGTDGNYGGGAPLGNYALATNSPAIDEIPPSSPTYSVAPTTDFFGNPRPDHVGGSVDVGAVEYQGASVATLTSITPSTGIQGMSANITITGTNMAAATGLTVSGSGVGVSAFTVNPAGTQITATLTIAPTAAATARTVDLLIPIGTTGTLTFTVVSPTLSSISPASGYRGGYQTPVTLTGSNLTGVNALSVSPSTGITVSNVAVNSGGTQVTATLTIASTTPTSSLSVSVTNSGGAVSNTLSSAFTVANPPVPTLTSISPNSGIVGTTVPVTLTGTSLLSTTGLAVSGTGVSVSGLTVVNDNTVTANLIIASNATVSARTVTATTLGGTSNSATFTVQKAPAPTLSGISAGTPPGGFYRGYTVPVTLTGTGLTTASLLTVSGTNVTVSNMAVVSDSTITANFTITTGASLTTRTVTVTTAGGTATVQFTVANPPTTLTSVTPNTGVRNANVSVTLTGTYLTTTTAVSISGSGVTASNLAVVNDNTVTATFAISSTATVGTRNVTITTVKGATTLNSAFTVQGATLTSISPGSGLQGTTVPVTLTGTNLSGATSVTVSSTGITVSGVTAVNSTTVTANFQIASNATLSSRNVAVVTPIGTTGNVTFQVQGPTLSTISPSSGIQGTSVLVTLTGNNLAGATQMTVSGSGVTASGVSANAGGTQVTATLTIGSSANKSNRNVTVTIPGGAVTNAETFSVVGPTLTSISPASGTHGTAVNVTLTGSNLTGVTTVNVGGTGITVSNVAVVSSTQVTATFTISSTASKTNRTVSVTNSGGATSSNVSGGFTVN